MGSDLTSCAFSARLFALVLGCSLGTTVPTMAQAPGELVEWRAEALNRGEAAVALSQFYATMYNSAQIATREVLVEKGDTPTQIMQREGSWPAYLGPSNRLLDSVVCDLNPSFCRREKTAASGERLTDFSRNVAATEPTDGNWVGLQPGAMLRIPDYSVERIYETIATSEAYLAKRYGDQARIERTDALAALYCNQPSVACPDQPVLTWEGDSRPPILQFDPRLFDPATDGATVPKDVMAAFFDSKARTVLAAVPYLRLRQNLALPRIGNPAMIGLDDIQQKLDSNMLVAPGLRTESTEGLQDWNRAFFDRMKFLPESPDLEEELSTRIVTIYHFDKQAQLQHCMFQNLAGIELFEWREGQDGQPAEPVAVTPASDMSDCLKVKGVAVESKDHGTHTLGLLVGQLATFTKALPVDVTYFKVVHVPLNAAQFESGNAPEAVNRIGPVLATLGVTTPAPDVVSMSLSWPAVGMDILDQNVLSKEDLITFVVAAPKQEGQNECARGPAGIKWSNGDFAQNVISVVGLNLGGLPGQSDIVLLEGAGTGSNCHEIGAFGALYGPIGDRNAVGELTGASQATPVVAATVAELIRRLPTGGPIPGRIGKHLIASAWFAPDLINRAKATLLDASTALRAEQDIIVTKSGCLILGEFVRINDSAGKKSDFFYAIENERQHVAPQSDLLSFRFLDADRVLVVRLVGEDIRVEIGDWQSGMNRRTIQFFPDDIADTGCDGITHDLRDISVSDVDQLIISKLGD